MVFVPLFWNAKGKKVQDIQQLPAERKPRIAPKKIVPKPEFYIITALGDLVRTFQLSAFGHPVRHEPISMSASVKHLHEAQISGVISRSALAVISGCQVAETGHKIAGSNSELMQFALFGKLSKAIIEYAKGKPILSIQELLDILSLFDEID
jgi:hypothetical protein